MNSLLANANTPFRVYTGSLNFFGEFTSAQGTVLRLHGGIAVDSLPMNEVGNVHGTVALRSTTRVTLTGPFGTPLGEVTDTDTTSEFVSSTLYGYLRESDLSFQPSHALIWYRFISAVNTLSLDFRFTESIENLVVDGIAFRGTLGIGGGLMAPFAESRAVQHVYTLSDFPTAIFLGNSGRGHEIVDHSLSLSGVTVDLQNNTGTNAYGGSDKYVGVNSVIGSAFNDTLIGDSQNNFFVGGAGNDTLVGGPGADTAEFAGVSSAYLSTKAGATTTVTGPDGIDTLTGIERLRFLDKGIAFDLGSADPTGMTVRIIGAAFDTPYLTRELVGVGIEIFESGINGIPIYMRDMCERVVLSPLFLSIAGTDSNQDFVNTLYRNIVGVLPSASERDSLVSLLRSGSMSKADLLMLAANTPENEVNINLVGLQQTGIEFV